MGTVTDDIDSNEWSHTLKIGLVRSTKQTLSIADVASIYGFFGNIGGAYSLLVLCFGLLYSISSPKIETEFRIPGLALLLWICDHLCVCRGTFPKLQFWPFKRALARHQAAKLVEVTATGPISASAPHPDAFSSLHSAESA